MKLTTKLIADDGDARVVLTVQSDLRPGRWMKCEQKKLHSERVNSAYDSLRPYFNTQEIKIK